MDQTTVMRDPRFELFTSRIQIVETSDSDLTTPKRAILKISLINEGSNSKHLLWTAETMSKVAHMFQGVPFRYDLNGQNEGSHTRDRLSSPFYDVGWTYSGSDGAWYDEGERCIWVKGEVTHPDVIRKLMRQTTDGKREINFASMGAMIDPSQTKCSICGKSPFGSCEHQRGEVYDGQTCCMEPTGISKALHVALTNDPADRIAEISEALFQDMFGLGAMPVAPNPTIAGTSSTSEVKSIIDEVVQYAKSKQMRKKDINSKLITEESTMAMEDEKKKKKEEKDDKVKEEKREDVEEKTKKGNAGMETSETTDKKETAKEEIKEKVDMKDDDLEDIKKKKKETAESSEKEDNKEDEEEDEKEKKKKKKGEKEEKESPEMAEDDVEFKISGPTDHSKAPQTLTQDNSQQKVDAPILETASNEYAGKYKKKLLMELADSYVKFNKAASKDAAIALLQDKSIEQLEIYQEAFDGIVLPSAQPQKLVLQDSNHTANQKFADAVPEYGGTVEQWDPYVEVQDMSPEERRTQFGIYGSFDVCFAPNNAQKYRK